MKRLPFLLFFLLVAGALWAHDMRLAHYVVHVEDERIVCDVKLDIEDFQEALNAELDPNTAMAFLQEHLVFEFDGEQVTTALERYQASTEWVEIRLVLETNNRQPMELAIFNDILSEEVSGHDNLMRFVLHDRARIFRLNKKRQQVSFSYKKR